MEENNLAPKPEALGKLFGVDMEKKPESNLQMPNLAQLDKDYDDEDDFDNAPSLAGLPNPFNMPSINELKQKKPEESKLELPNSDSKMIKNKMLALSKKPNKFITDEQRE